MLKWLESENVVEASKYNNWPTSETREAWLEFVALQTAAQHDRWGDYAIPMNVTFHKDMVPLIGSRVFILQSDTGAMVCAPDMMKIGESSTTIPLMPFSSGIADVVNANTVSLHYVGPIVHAS